MEFIHINCDLGEGGNHDEQLMPLISACNVASGGHAGTLESMRETVVLAMENNIEIGAHPSYPDKVNFGRKSIDITEEELKISIIAQILSIKQITEAEGGKLNHVKPHGALYNDASKDEKIAKIIIDSIMEVDKNLPIFAPYNSVIFTCGKGKIKLISEAFADRNYEENYQLVSREKAGAIITQKKEVLQHLSGMFLQKKITCKNGKILPLHASTFCLHSDTPNSVEIMKYLHSEFEKNSIKIYRKDD